MDKGLFDLGFGAVLARILQGTHRSPWFNLIERKWVYTKRPIVEPAWLLSTQEVADWVCAYVGCLESPEVILYHHGSFESFLHMYDQLGLGPILNGLLKNGAVSHQISTHLSAAAGLSRPRGAVHNMKGG